MRPVLRGLCRYDSLHDAALTLVDFARMNDALDVMDENEARMREAAKANG